MKDSFRLPEQYRMSPEMLALLPMDDAFIIPFEGEQYVAISSIGPDDWEHVSVSPMGKQITPTWDVMCHVKDLFWEEEACVLQHHPPKSTYVNLHPHCLHLWRKPDSSQGIPPEYMTEKLKSNG